MGTEEEQVSVGAEKQAAPAQESAANPLGEEQIWEALKSVNDPELHIDIVSLGLVYKIDVRESEVDVEMTLTTPGCPYGPQLLYAVDYAVRAVEGVSEVSINVVWTPPWSPERMSDDAKLDLGFDI